MAEINDEYIKKIEELENKIKILDNKQNEVNEKLRKLDSILNKIQEEFYLDENYDEGDILEIACPYCNYIFETELDENKNELQCPECKNIIELDWECCDDDCKDEGCSHCGGGCCSHHDEDEDM